MMSRPFSADTSYLEVKDRKYRVVVAVPRALHPELGTKLKRSLNTDSLATANSLKWQVVAELKARISSALGRGGRDPLTREALTISAMRSRAKTDDDLYGLDAAISIRTEQIAGPALSVDEDANGTAVEVRDTERERRAIAFAEMAAGRATPISYHHPDYLKQLTVKPRTRADDERALRYLEDWCARNRVAATLQLITRKVATSFMDGLGTVTKGQSNVTLQKYLIRLSVYWKWLLQREHVETNVWAGLKLPTKQVAHDEMERPFSKEEMLKLLAGPATPHMHDLMRIAALTGARLDVIVDLRAGDCANGVFLFKPQKKESGMRAVPIHSDLAAIVNRRTKGREASADVFPEWPAPHANSLREKSFKASNAFTAYRREIGVDERVDGKRRSLVNFHSFRRWFITEAERAGQPEHIIAAVVGHKRQGMTLGRYSAGPLLEQARQCIQAVNLPYSEAKTSSVTVTK